MVASITRLRDHCGASGLKGVGIGVPGFILIDKGIILGSNNLPEFEGFPVRDVIEQKLGTSVVLENDANAAALGEKWIGAGREVDDLVLLTLGTGIGGGIISGGRVLRGFVGMAGELGHLTVVPNGNPCGCGNQGCVEKHASATAVTAMARLMQLGEELTSKQGCSARLICRGWRSEETALPRRAASIVVLDIQELAGGRREIHLRMNLGIDPSRRSRWNMYIVELATRSDEAKLHRS